WPQATMTTTDPIGAASSTTPSDPADRCSCCWTWGMWAAQEANSRPWAKKTTVIATTARRRGSSACRPAGATAAPAGAVAVAGAAAVGGATAPGGASGDTDIHPRPDKRQDDVVVGAVVGHEEVDVRQGADV